MVKQPFYPQYGATLSVATAAAAVNTTVSAQPKQLHVYNDGTAAVFVRVKPQGTTADATVADLPVPSKGRIIITKDPQSTNTVSVFSPGGAVGNVYLTPGDGYGAF